MSGQTLEALLFSNQITLSGLAGFSDEKIREYAVSNHKGIQQNKKTIDKQVEDLYNYSVKNAPDYSYIEYYKLQGKTGVLKDFARVAPDLFPDLAMRYPASSNLPATANSGEGLQKYLTKKNMLYAGGAIATAVILYKILK